MKPDQSRGPSRGERGRVTRRRVLAALGATPVASVAGCGDAGTDGGGTTTTDGGTDVVDEGGPPDQSNWTLAHEDRFDAGTLDTDTWSVGYGFTDTDCHHRACVADDHVRVDAENDRLVLETSDEADGLSNDYATGCINSRSKLTGSAGTYWEAKFRTSDGAAGVTPAFWLHNQDNAWPPEIDVYEVFGESTDEISTTIHYDCGTGHEQDGSGHDVDPPVTESWYVVGCAWTGDAVRWYLDGTLVKEVTGEPVACIDDGVPMYAMLDSNVIGDFSGNPDTVEDWPAHHYVDWFRQWELRDGATPATPTGDSDEEADENAGSDRDSKISWHATEPVAWENPAALGTLNFAGPDGDSGDLRYADPAPAVDGSADGAWDQSVTFDLENVLLGGDARDGPSDLSATARALYDDSTLYVRFDVTDDAIVTDGGDVHRDDSGELFLDVGDTDTEAYDETAFQYLFRADGSDMVETKNEATDGVEWATTETDDGYRIEVGIPLATVGAEASVGAPLGIDFHVNDDDGGE